MDGRVVPVRDVSGTPIGNAFSMRYPSPYPLYIKRIRWLWRLDVAASYSSVLCKWYSWLLEARQRALVYVLVMR